MANKQMKLYKYAYAIGLYKNYIKKEGGDTLVFKQLGEAYKLVNQYDSALIYFNKASNLGAKLDSILPELHAITGNYSIAKQEYEKLIAINKTLYKDRRFYGFSNIEKFYADSLDFHIFQTKLNTPYNDYNVVPYKDGLVFESNRVNTKYKKRVLKQVSPEFAWDGSGYSKLFYIKNINDIRIDTSSIALWRDKHLTNKQFYIGTSNDTRILDKSLDFHAIEYKQDTGIKLFSNQIGGQLNIGSITFTKNGKTAYFTRNGRKTNKGYLLEIWEANFYEGKWHKNKKLFFNKNNYNYFHPSVTSDGNRLYYVSDEPNGYGGTDIYYIDKNEDGSWKPTSNAGQDINTSGNELFPTFYEGVLYFSSNGHPGLGGLDIFKLAKDARGDLTIKNLGYPINSDKDDLNFYINNGKGFFSSNRNGSDDIFAFDYVPIYINMCGTVMVDSILAPGKNLYLTQRNEFGKTQIIDSTVVDKNGNYCFKGRPNKDFNIVTNNGDGDQIIVPIKSNSFVKNNEGYEMLINLINIPLTPAQIYAKRIQQDELIAKQQNASSQLFAKTIDSLMKLTKDYIALHHPFNMISIVEKDKAEYYKLISRVRKMKGREIVIVSATDCNGTEQYNEGLSERRAKHLYNNLVKLSKNKVVIKHVGERELLKACDDLQKSIEEQFENRYSYVFILEKNNK